MAYLFANLGRLCRASHGLDHGLSLHFRESGNARLRPEAVGAFCFLDTTCKAEKNVRRGHVEWRSSPFRSTSWFYENEPGFPGARWYDRRKHHPELRNVSLGKGRRDFIERDKQATEPKCMMSIIDETNLRVTKMWNCATELDEKRADGT